MADETRKWKENWPHFIKRVLGERQARFDKQGDRFYDLISAFINLAEGSAPDAALCWYAEF